MLRAEESLSHSSSLSGRFHRFLLSLFSGDSCAAKTHDKALEVIQLRLNGVFKDFSDQLCSIRKLIYCRDYLSGEEKERLLRRLEDGRRHLVEMGDQLPVLPKQLSMKVDGAIEHLLSQNHELRKSLFGENT